MSHARLLAIEIDKIRWTHWLVSLAMSGRQLLVRTLSDHWVRPLRGLVARPAPGSTVEQLSLDSVSILEENQDETGRSTNEPMHLSADGTLGAHWPNLGTERSDRSSGGPFVRTNGEQRQRIDGIPGLP